MEAHGAQNGIQLVPYDAIHSSVLRVGLDGRKATPFGEFVTFALMVLRVPFVFNVFIFVWERKLDSVLLSGQDEIEGGEELYSTDKDNNKGNVPSTPNSESPLQDADFVCDVIFYAERSCTPSILHF